MEGDDVGARLGEIGDDAVDRLDHQMHVAAGADTFVAGAAIFGKPDYKAVIDAMRAELAKTGK